MPKQASSGHGTCGLQLGEPMVREKKPEVVALTIRQEPIQVKARRKEGCEGRLQFI